MSIPRSLTPLASWLDTLNIPPLIFLEASLQGEAPPVIRFGGKLYIDGGDESRWRASLISKATRRSIDLVAHELGNAR
jgi:hypothetical protein